MAKKDAEVFGDTLYRHLGSGNVQLVVMKYPFLIFIDRISFIK